MEENRAENSKVQDTAQEEKGAGSPMNKQQQHQQHT